MPAPVMVGVGVVAAIVGGKGVQKGMQAHDKMKKAENINQEAQNIVKRTQNNINSERESTNSELISLGRKKISIMTNGIKDFVDEFSQIKNVNLKDSVGLEELHDFDPDSKDFLELKEASLSLGELASGGLGSVGAGALAAAGAYGAVGSFAAASTGTAIAGLSGAAATNATLAWLGGGSLAAGGLGVAGGMAVLGGLVAGPLLFVGGAFYESKANEALSGAKTNHSKARQFREEGNSVCTLLSAIGKRSRQIESLLSELNGLLMPSIDDMRQVIHESGTDWKKYTEDEKITIGESAQIAQAVKQIVDTSLLREDGNLTDESEHILDKGNAFVRKLVAQ